MRASLAKTNKILALLAVGLMLGSFLSYNASVRRAERFERGQKFLPNLNPDEIATIQVTKGSEQVHLRQEGERFVVVDADGYPASNDSVNRFIRDVLDLGLEKKVGTGEGLREELALVSGGAETTEVTFKDPADKDMVQFLVGKGQDDGGNYVVRLDGEDSTIYLTSARVFLATDGESFLQKQIVDVPATDVAAVRGADFRIEKGEDDQIALAELPGGYQENATAINGAKGALAGLRFNQHHLANAGEVAGLRFDDWLEIELTDGSGYRAWVAKNGDKHYLRIEGFHSTERVEVAMDATEEEVKETSEILVRADEIQAFNTFQGSWVYEVSEVVADKFRIAKQDLMERG